MRILKVTQSYAPFFEFGGPPTKVRALAEGMVKKGHRVTVLTADWGLDRRLASSANEPAAEACPFGRRLRVNGVSIIYLATWLHYRAASWNPVLGRYLRACLQDFDVAHIFGLYDLLGPRVAAGCRIRRIPYIVEPIGMFVPIVRNIWLKRLYQRIWGHEMIAKADVIIATAEREREELLAGGLDKEKIVLRRNGVDGPSVLPERGLFREEMKIPQGVPLVLFLGRLSVKKSPDLLLKAFASLGQCAAGVRAPHLVFVGPDEAGMKARLQQLAAQLAVADRVFFSPALRDAAKWKAYRDADIFVLPSQNENFGNTAAEAVAAGTPVIVTDQCGVAPLLKDVAALVVRHDEADLTQGMARLLQDEALRNSLREGCARAAADLDWVQPLQAMDAIYRRLAPSASS